MPKATINETLLINVSHTTEITIIYKNIDVAVKVLEFDVAVGFFIWIV